MAKRKASDDGYIPRITITTGDDLPEPNSTFLDFIRDGEKPKPGEPGTLHNRLGAEMQDFLSAQVHAANHGRGAVKGKVTITMDFVTGPDGSHNYATTFTAKTAKIRPRASIAFTDPDGEMLSRPMTDGPLTDEMQKRVTKTVDPKAGATSPT